MSINMEDVITYERGFTFGYERGKDDWYIKGYKKGYKAGYDDGRKDGLEYCLENIQNLNED